MTKFSEINFDGLVGPTHNYAGLSEGNVASAKHRHTTAHPKAAALQGLQKMKFLQDLGIKQAVLPPQERPHLPTLRALGFAGTDEAVIRAAIKHSPVLMANVSSASCMWTANAATVTPSTDASDGRVHFTPANLAQFFHRSIEATQTARVLRAIFADANYFTHHEPLPAGLYFGDEGAANHTRLYGDSEKSGLEVFVYGRRAFDRNAVAPKRFPARQTLEASEVIVRTHGLARDGVFFIQQNPEAIDAGVFHNDVVAVGNGDTLFCHEMAFHDQTRILIELKNSFQKKCQRELHIIEVKAGEVSLEEAVASYLFNTQLVTLPDGTMALIAPTECRESKSVQTYLDALVTQNTPIRKVHYVDVRQSMQNGGGPACLRLRITLAEEEMAAASQGVFFNDALYDALKIWVEKHYRDEIAPEDILDPNLYRESCTALDELTQILKLGKVYEFQRE